MRSALRSAVWLCLSSICFAGSPAFRYEPAIDRAFTHLYGSDFTGAQHVLDEYLAKNSSDPLAYSVKASGYLFSELNRLGILEADFFRNDDRIVDQKKHLKPDPQVRDLFYSAVDRAKKMADDQLAKDPDNTNALFAASLANGNLTDYLALVEKKQLQSLSVNKEGYRYSKRLVKVAPDFFDAQLTAGVTEYLLGSVPVVFRWFLRFDDVKGDKRAGIRKLEIVAERGHYLKPFAKILLATAALRDKRPNDAKRILQELTQLYPQNALLKRELDRISTQL